MSDTGAWLPNAASTMHKTPQIAAPRRLGSDYTRCTFVADSQEPDCFGYGALGGSLLRVHGLDIIGGTGRYEGVTGTMPKNKEVHGGSDVVMKLRLK